MASNANYQNIDLVPQEALTQIAALDTNLKATITTSGDYLKAMVSINSQLNKNILSYKDLNAIIADYNKTEQNIINLQKEQSAIINQVNKVRNEAIHSTTEQNNAAKELAKTVVSSTEAIKQNVSLVDLSKKAFDEASKSIGDQNKNLIRLQLGLKNIQKSISDLDKEYKNNRVTENDYVERKAVLIDRERDQKATIDTLNKTIQSNTKIINTTIGTYDNLSAQYTRLKIAVNGLSDSEKLNGKTKQELEAHAKSLYEEMSRLQKQTGKHQLDVGQYDKAVTDLTKTISIIDPRIGALITKIQKITPIKSAWLKVNNQLVKSLNVTARTATIMQAAIVGLIGGAILLAIEAFKNWKAEQEEMIQKRQEDIDKTNEQSRQIAESVSKQVTSYKLLQDQWNNLADDIDTKNKFLKDNRDEFHQLGIEINTVAEAENVFVSNSDAVVKSFALRAQASAALKLAEEQYRNYIQALIAAEKNTNNILKGTIFDPTTGQNVEVEYDLDANIDPALKKQKELVLTVAEFSKEQAETSGQDFLSMYIKLMSDAKKVLQESGITIFGRNDEQKAEDKALQDLLNLRIKREKEAAENIYRNDIYTYGQRITALNNFSQTQVERIQAAAKNQLKDTTLTATQRTFIEEKAAYDIQQVWDNHSNEIDKINKDKEKKQKENDKKLEESIKKQADLLNQSLKISNATIDREESSESLDLSAQYQSGELNAEEYEKAKTELTRKYAKQRFEAEVAIFEQLANLYINDENERAKIQARIADARLQNEKDVNDAIIKDNERAAKKKEEIEKKRNRLLKQLGQELMNVFSALFNARIEQENNALDEQLEKLRENYTERFAVVDQYERDGLISAEQAQAQRDYLTEKQKQSELDIENQKKEIALRQAKYEKNQALLSIALSTAVGIAQALPNFVLAGLVAAIGAAQAIVVASQPLPQYKHGTLDHPGGKAVLGDGYKSEMILLPDGKIKKSPAFPTTMDLPEHAQVWPDYNEAIKQFSIGVISGNKDIPNIIVVKNKEELSLMKSTVQETRQMKQFILDNNKMTARMSFNQLYGTSKNRNDIYKSN